MGRDAFGLADALRLGAIEQAVYKERGGYAALGYRARGYRWIRDDAVRVKNRLKSVYRSRGVAVAGMAVYTAAKRGAYLTRLPMAARPLAELLYEELDALACQKRKAEGALLAEANRHPAAGGRYKAESGEAGSAPLDLTHSECSAQAERGED